MFGHRRYTTKTASAFGLAERIFHSTVRNIRKTHGHAVLGLVLNIFQTLMFVGAYFALVAFSGARQVALRGDFLMFIVSGVFVFMVHVKAIGAVAGAEDSTSSMMKHAPMNTAVSICSAALASLYIQILSMTVLLFLYHALWAPVVIDDPVGVLAMTMLAWLSGVGIGMVLLALKPWNPRLAGLVTTILMRVNMVASGKMVVANVLGYAGILFFGWNPLYHAIDQTRGFMFVNYEPHFTSITYPVVFALVCVVIGMMGEFFTRQYASVSWQAGK